MIIDRRWRICGILAALALGCLPTASGAKASGCP